MAAPWIDRVVGWFSPQWALKRAQHRNALQLASRGYRSGQPGRLSRPPAGGQSPDNHLEVSYDRRNMVDRSRRLRRDSILAAACLDRAVELRVGKGLRPCPSSGDPDWDKRAMDRFERWALKEADARRMSTFYEMQRLVCLAHLGDGDVGIAKLKDGSQLVYPSDLIASPPGKEQDPLFRDGVELDRQGRIRRFHVVQGSPESHFYGDRRHVPEREVIDRANFCWLPRRKYPDQTRGIPAYAQSEWLFEHVDGLLEAVVVASRMAACYGLVIETPYGPHTTGNTGTGADGKTYTHENFEPGGVKYLEEGEKLSQLTPTQPRTDFSDFLSELSRFAGLSLGLPLQLVLLHYDQANLANTRAAMLQAWKTSDIGRCFLVEQWLMDTWDWLVRRWIASGELGLPRFDGGVGNPFACDWVGDPRPMFDPLSELQAHALALDLGTQTLPEILRAQGKRMADAIERAGEAYQARIEAGLPDIRSTLTRDPAQAKPEADAADDAGDDDAGDDEDTTDQPGEGKE